jgi:hypothetical protein
VAEANGNGSEHQGAANNGSDDSDLSNDEVVNEWVEAVTTPGLTVAAPAPTKPTSKKQAHVGGAWLRHRRQ